MLKIKNDYHKMLEIDYEKTRKYAVQFEKLSEGKKISLMNDNMFKTMFVNSKRVKYGAKLISYFIDKSYDDLLNSIRLLNNEVDKENVYVKSQRCDYVAQIDDAIVNIEVNCNSTIESLLRNLTYGFKWFTKEISVGSEYNFTQMIQINLNNFAFKDDNEVFNISYLQNDNHFVLTDKLAFINVSIPVLREKWYNKERLSEVERYILSLIETDVESALKIGMGDSFMESSVKEQVKFCMTDDLREAYDHELAMKEEFKRQGLMEGREEGFSQGIAEGRAQGREEGRKEGRKEGREEGHAEGRKEGHAQGHEEGRLEGKKEIINKFLESGMTKQEISKILGVSQEELESYL